MRVLTWNLYHGRGVPPAGRALLDEYSAALAGWEWDVALLQEVPPWWPPVLGGRSGAAAVSVLTSRNGGLALRRRIAERWPDAIKSNGGGANAILVRGTTLRGPQRSALLRRAPERRRLHAVELDGRGWVGNLHAQGTQAEAARAAAAAQAWAGGGPIVLGGDFNLPEPSLPGLVRAGGHGVDLVFVRGWSVGASEVMAHGRLSDHAPVRVSLRARSAPAR